MNIGPIQGIMGAGGGDQAIYGYDPATWARMSPEERMRAFLAQPGNSGFAAQIYKQQNANPNSGFGGTLMGTVSQGNNYWNKYLQAIAANRGIPQFQFPHWGNNEDVNASYPGLEG